MQNKLKTENSLQNYRVPSELRASQVNSALIDEPDLHRSIVMKRINIAYTMHT